MSQSHNKPSNALFLFFIQPFLGFLVSLKYLNSRVGKFVFIAFSTLWGYAQSFTYTPADGYRIGAGFCQSPVRGFSTILDVFAEGRAIDGYLLITNYFVHLFSDNVKVYFALLGFVYGALCYGVLSSLMKERTNAGCKSISHVLFLLFAIASFSNLSMPRFWTAAWLAALIFLKVTQGYKRWGWLSLLLPLIHFSFVPIAIILFLMTWLNKFLLLAPNTLFWAVCIMFFLSFAMPKTVIRQLIPEEMIDDSPKLASKLGYVSDSQTIEVYKEVSAYREANGIVTRAFQFLMKVGSFLMLLYFHRRRNVIRNDRKIWTTYTSVMAVAIVVYFMSIIPSTGWRYVNVLWLMLFILLHRYYDVFRPKQFGKVLLSLYAMNVYTISFIFYVAYRTVDLLLFYAPLPIVIIHGIGFPPVYYV